MPRKKFSIRAAAVLLAGALFFPAPADAQYNAFKDPSASTAASASAGADFRAVTEKIAGGKIAVGASAYIVVMFKNQGAAAVKAGSVNLYPSSTVSAQIALNQCADAPVTTDAQCAITVVVMGKQSGAWRVEMLVDHGGPSRVATASMSGDVEMIVSTADKVTKGDLDASPASLDFGVSPGGSALVRSIVLDNRSAESVKIRGISLAAPEQSGIAYKSQCPETLQPEETCNIIVTWSPSSKGLTQGVLVVQHSGKSGMAQVEVKGDLKPLAGDVEASPASLDFGTSSGGIALVRSVILSNHSAEEIQVWSVDMDVAAKSGFSYKSQCPETLQPEETCSIVVSWLPTSKGLVQGVLMARHSGKSGMTPVELKGTLMPSPDEVVKAAEGISVSPATLGFGTSGGGIALVKSIVLNNNSSQVIKIKDISLNIPKQSGFSYKSQCPEDLLPEESCTIIVTWLPTTKGLSQGVLLVKHSGKSGMAQVEVSGTLQSAAGGDLATGGVVEMSPASLDFGISPGGVSMVRSIMLSNRSDEDVEIWDVNMNAAKQSGISYESQCPETLMAEESCTILVTWLPTTKGLAQGVLVAQHSGRSGMVQAEVSGTLQPLLEDGGKEVVEGVVELSPGSLDFGTSAGGMALVRSIVLSNHSARAVNIKEIVLNVPEQSGLSFKSQCQEVLQPDDACSIIVTWLPTSKGQAQGVLVVLHSGKGGMSQSEVKGMLQPAAVTSATAYPESVPDRGLLVSDKEVVDFGSGIKEQASITLSLVNAGNSDLDFKSIKLAGSSNGLSIANTGCSTEGAALKPGEACALTVRWLPSHGGAILDSLQIIHTGARGVLVVPVRGSADGPALVRGGAANNIDYGAFEYVADEAKGDPASGKGRKDAKATAAPAVSTISASQAAANAKQAAIKASQAVMRAILQTMKSYTITSHSATRAVINGSAGGLVVHDGEDVVISGVKWTVTIVATGVILTSDKNEVRLMFDRSLKSLTDSASPVSLASPAEDESSVARSLPPTIGGMEMINP